ncbi:MAG TPA: metalloregulator ArsR/SmtB family transcription factor [Acidobacteriota bacterium]|nr:metalloregulator ArsR/SmtB family transcription factor [Acidobacteriota bacterium]
MSESRGAGIEGAVPVFAALGDQTRLQLLKQLSQKGPDSISRLSEGVAVTRQAVTKHLNVLADAGLVRGERRGREHIWELKPGRLSEARDYLDRISLQWDEALHRLKGFVEDDDSHS